MNSGPFPQPYPLLFLVLPIILFLNYLPQCLSITDWFSICNTTKFSCGNITGVDFPFWGDSRPDHCGYPHLKLHCSRNITTIEIGNATYLVLNINQAAQTLKILRSDLRNGVCSPQFGDTAFDTKQFEYDPDSVAIHLFYDCANKKSPFLGSYFTCADGSSHRDGYVLVDSGETETGTCNSSVTIGLQRSYYWIFGNSSSINQVVREGFQLKYRADSEACKWCASYGGACGYNSNSTEVSCFYKPPTVGPISNSEAATVPDKHGSSSKRKWVIGISVPLFGLITTSIMIAYAFKKGNLAFWKKDDRNEFEVEAFIRISKSLAPTRYSYSSVKKMTNSFAEEIGRGGFGSVYKGKLGDGRLVAVKVLNETKDNGEDFINEVASIGNTSHVNIVTLIGFCYGRAKRALIYEFMPNGSLDKFIFSAESTDDRSLEWKVLFDITVGIARGLEYLHRGCKTRILHFDIKPQNILLDKNFCPKISDFGLAKLWLRKESVMSTIEARGTAAYIAPEVFNRNYGGVSHKSDVYSYGMLVLEMVGGRKNFDAGVSQSSEVYYPHWIYKQTIELGNDLTSLGVTTDEENEMSRKMVLVGFWCIQTNPADRPSMSKVVEMLEGSVESLDIPPKPFLFSPTVSPQRSTGLLISPAIYIFICCISFVVYRIYSVWIKNFYEVS